MVVGNNAWKPIASALTDGFIVKSNREIIPAITAATAPFAVAFFQPAIHLSARFWIKPDGHLFF